MLVPQRSLTISYKPVSNARGGKTTGGKAGARGSSAARQISYITGEPLRDPTDRNRISNERDDVIRWEMHHWDYDRLRKDAKDLQRLADAVQTIDGRKNARQGARYIVALPGDPMERWDPELRAKMDRLRWRIADEVVGHIAREAPGAYVYAIHAPPEGAPGSQYHLHVYGTRREVERVSGEWMLTGRNLDVYGGSKMGPDGDPKTTFGGVADLMQRLRPRVARTINDVCRYYGVRHEVEHRSHAAIAEEMNAKRRAEGLPELETRIASKKEGPAATRRRRLEAQGRAEEVEEVQVGSRSRAAMEHNDRIAELNAAVDARNAEITKHDAVLTRVYLPLLRVMEEMHEMEHERLRCGRKDIDGLRRTPEERERYAVLEAKLDRIMRESGTNLYALKRSLERLPAPIRDHLVATFPRAGATAVERPTGISGNGMQQGDRGDRGWTLFGLPRAGE